MTSKDIMNETALVIARGNTLQHILESERVMDMINESGKAMITWLSTDTTVPAAGREIIAKNPLRPDSPDTARRQCKVIKYHLAFKEEQIKKDLLDDNFTLWAYTEGVNDE